MEKVEKPGLGTDKGEVDVSKLLLVSKSSLIWILGIFVLVFSISYLFFIRWNNPVYEAVSDLKLDIKTESTLLGIENPTPNLNSISAEIELITSRYFFGRVIEELEYNVSYYFYGKVLVEERYGNSPFHVVFDLQDNFWLDKKFDLEMTGPDEFILKSDFIKNKIYTYNDPIEIDGGTLIIQKNPNFFDPTDRGSYYFTINSKESLIKYFDNNFNAAPLNLSGKSIRLSLKDENKLKAREFLTAIDTLYLYYTLEEKQKARKLQIEFLNEQLRQTEKKLEEYEDYFENFTVKNKTVNLDQEMGEAIAQMEEVEKRKFDLSSKMITINIFLDELSKSEPLLTNPFEDSDLPEELIKPIRELQKAIREKEILLGSHKENTFVIEQQNNKIEHLKSSVKNLLLKAKREISQELAILNDKLEMINKNFQSLPSLGTEYTKNQRNYKLFEGFYLSQLQKKAEFEIAQAGMVTDFAILTPAHVSDRPISPKPLFVYGGAFVASFVFSLILIAMRYLLHNQITSLRELETLTNAPVLGIVPHFSGEKMDVTKLVVDKRPKSVISEAMRSLRTNMDFVNPGKEKRVITISSTVSGEGKSFVAVNLGAIIAMSQQKVLVLDVDMRKPKVHEAFEDKKENKGLSTVLIKRNNYESCIKTTNVKNLDYMQAGPTPPNPSELILSREFDLLLQELKSVYDVIILDSPPVGLVTDAVILMKKSDLQAYILRANYSRRSFVDMIHKLISVNNFKNLTLILNAVPDSKNSGYGYGMSYSGYYEETESKAKKRFKFLTNIFNL
jgi:capsular exopolysaccharide synthesis family protein